jgi:hypothetical protein
MLGAYLAIYPMNKVRIWLGWLFGTVELPAFIVIGVWFLGQYVSAFYALEHGLNTGVAYWDHLGGFVTGFASIKGYVYYLRWELSDEPTPDPEPVGARALPNAGTPEVEAAKQADDPFDTFFRIGPPPVPRQDVQSGAT